MIILVPCWDEYSWLWTHWYDAFEKYWAVDCEVIFTTEHKPFDRPGIENVKVGNCGTLERIRRALSFVKDKHFFLWQEDMFPKIKVDVKTIEILFETFKDRKMDSLRIQHQCPHTTYNKGSGTVEQIDRESPYFFSFQPSFMTVDYFLRVSKNAKDLWDLEMNKSHTKGYDNAFFYEYDWYDEIIRQGKFRDNKTAKELNEKLIPKI